MVPAVAPLRSLSTARSCARIDSRPDTAKIGSADRVEVHHAWLLAAIGVRKTFPHGLVHSQKLNQRACSAPAVCCIFVWRDCRRSCKLELIRGSARAIG